MKSLGLPLVISAAVALGPSASGRSTHQAVLSDSEMRQVAIAGVRSRAPAALQLPSFGFDHSRSEGYVYFEAFVDVGEGHVGFYVIDPRTGDMWDGVSDCGEITSPEIRRLQARLRQRLRLSRAQYLKIKRRGPMCDQVPR